MEDLDFLDLEDYSYVLISSVEKSMDKFKITGQNNIKAFKSLNVILDSLKYALFRYSFGAESYKSIVYSLIEKLRELQRTCPDICFFPSGSIAASLCLETFDNN